MKTKEQVAAEIKKILKDNAMTMLCVSRFDAYDETPYRDVHLALETERYDYTKSPSNIVISRE